jgi:hypothetical protein
VNAMETISVTYYLNQSGDVTINLVDVTGKTVAILSDGYELSGQKVSQCKLPSEISNGVYFVRIISANDAFNTKKVLVF